MIHTNIMIEGALDFLAEHGGSEDFAAVKALVTQHAELKEDMGFLKGQVLLARQMALGKRDHAEKMGVRYRAMIEFCDSLQTRDDVPQEVKEAALHARTIWPDNTPEGQG